MEIAITRITPTAPPVSWPRLLRRLHSGQLPEFIICATIALAARFSNRPEFSCIPRYNAGREYAKRAAELISGVVDKPDPDVVFCMVMLSMYEWGCGRGESAWSYTGMATRLAQRCRLHLVDEEDFTENDNIGNSTWATTEWRRRLWWIVYCGDRTSVIVASRPATVHDDDCVVNLPTHDHEWLMGTIPRDDEVDDTDENKQSKSTGSSQQILDNKIPDCWWMVVELYSMCSRISEFANRRRRPVRSSDIPRRAMFDILDRELEDLRSRFIPGVEFPPHTEWLLSRFANLDHGANSMFNLFALYFNIHMMYYASKIILYRSELPEYTHETISPELIARAKTVCVDAAQKQADVIRWALDNIPVENWDPKIGVWSLQGASIHVNAALSDDNVIAERSRKDLEVHLKLHVASDQYYHFNMAIITMLHHIFNLRKKQRLALGSGAATNAMVTKSDMGW
ncbi:fungal-specific transcription factor domain-containing protein [Coemansia spiralis]|nr:fungal-specific transcription factor domain-containing protein [Coemansia spiralis]